jgi:hypothetical protein
MTTRTDQEGSMRRLLIQIPSDDYHKLQHLAARDDRSPDRQAAWLLRQRLGRVTLPQAEPAESRELVTTSAGDDRPAA